MSTQPRRSVGSGTQWEEMAGYARAVRVADRILVAGTVASGPDGQPVGRGDAAAQARYVLDKIGVAVAQLGGTMDEVVRTRIYVSDIRHWEAVARVHGERFRAVRPVTTLVEARLVDNEYLVEIEAELLIGSAPAG